MDASIEMRPTDLGTSRRTGLVARRIRVRGIVQGVGFRPFVATLAARHSVAGFVRNDGLGVVIEVEGSPLAIARFGERLVAEAPPLAVLERVETEPIASRGLRDFAIRESRAAGERRVLVSPDIATCEECLRELLDPANRRFEYPLINCTNCGPRFTIIRDVPYDRPSTTMAGFAMCADCAAEYRDPGDRRFHAQPISCRACGPTLRLLARNGEPLPGDPIRGASELLREGRLVAVKGLGGYHLAALAASEAAVAMLRARKQREEKPFAVMMPDRVAAHELAEVGVAEERALASPRRPIVLCRRRDGAPVAAAVAPGSRFLGLLLPYTPLHHLLCRELREPFVLTSGNLSDEPIAHEDADAFERLGAIADFFLVHDRPIETRADDSVVRVFRDREIPVRRSRGFAPQPILLDRPARRPILACGAELKNTFCLVKDRHAFLSHHVGDLENWPTMCAYREGIARYGRLFDVVPEVVAYDLHPEYLSTKYALELAGVELVGVQHHHAHIAACLADNGAEGPVIGVAFDGLGYGPDGTMWGGEFLVADLAGFERVAHLEAVPMPGGAAAIREPWRMAASWLAAACGEGVSGALAVRERNRSRWASVERIGRARMTQRTSSIGRLFDAVAAIAGVRDSIAYEGQAAVELEQRADPSEERAYPVTWSKGVPIVVCGGDLVRAVVDDVTAGAALPSIAARFHNGVARMIRDVCGEIRGRTGLTTVALSGGVFQNLFLLERAARGLEEAGFRVLVHGRVPCNDGGISFGQAVVAAARDRRPVGTRRSRPTGEVADIP